jgi:hypothetical protein
MRLTKNRPAIDALDMPGLEDVGALPSHTHMGLHGLLHGLFFLQETVFWDIAPCIFG